MTAPTLSSQVIALLGHGQGQQEAFLRDVSPDERDREGSPEDPSPKVVLAHITEFKEQQVLKVRAAASAQIPPPLEAVEPSDPVVYARLDSRSWQEAEADAERVTRELTAEVERLTDDDLRDATRFPWLDGRPLCRQVLGRGLWHPLTHLRDYYVQRGQEARPAELERQLAAFVTDLGFMPVPGDGMSFYNLGCAYAVAGEHDKAIALLQTAVQTDDKYADHARHDADLVMLRDEPRFATLFR